MQSFSLRTSIIPRAGRYLEGRVRPDAGGHARDHPRPDVHGGRRSQSANHAPSHPHVDGPSNRLIRACLAGLGEALHFLETTLSDQDDYTGDGVSILERVSLCRGMRRRAASTRGPHSVTVGATTACRARHGDCASHLFQIQCRVSRPKIVDITFAVAGRLTRDYILPPVGLPLLDAPGGSGLYACGGVRTWHEAVGLMARVGEDYPRRWLKELETQGVDTAGVTILEQDMDVRAFYAYDANLQGTRTSPVCPVCAAQARISKDAARLSNADGGRERRAHAGGPWPLLPSRSRSPTVKPVPCISARWIS